MATAGSNAGEMFRERPSWRRRISAGIHKLFAVFCKRLPSLPEINEEPQNISQEAGRNNDKSAATGISELEQTLKQKMFTSDPLLRVEASTSGSHGDYFHASRVVEEQIVSPAELLKTSMTMENLPNELLINIFIRLLSKQLAQMRSVSRSWNALLSHSSFVKSHLDYSIHNNDRILLHFNFYLLCSDSTPPFSAYPLESPHADIPSFIKLPLQPKHSSITIIGSINGLICFSYRSTFVIHIWNPSLSAVLTLPPYSLPYDSNSMRIHFRFGYDPNTDDYKVIKLTTGSTKSVVKWWLQVEIYSMRKGSWELISERFSLHITSMQDRDFVCVDGHDGHLHWLGFYSSYIDSQRIVAFDLSLESFREIPLPCSILNNYNNLGVLKGKLCVMSRAFHDTSIEVWVMNDYEVVESWVKCHVFSELNLEFNLETFNFGFTSHNEFLVDDYDDGLVLYDPVADNNKILNQSRPSEGKMVEYVDSLVWVAR